MGEQSWFDIDYLLAGNPRQRVAWGVLTELGIFRYLAPFTPVLTGTVPIGLDLDHSDLDIICAAEDLVGFEQEVVPVYAHHPGFGCKRRLWQGRPSVVINFDTPFFPIEIFAQALPVTEQNAFRHMLIEERLLRLGGDAARTAILALRRAGMKTEPAFAAYFRLDGDPYAALLRLARLDDAKNSC
ncbi:MAG: DUF4269 domain-containing protein [Caldilineaceae bacterium]|nr:DUF4269 domain-containing protein [Caldilineaceae bacterium]MBP8108366.1 DUF4269 domain-containing protein [Caldilineaceae bacterium]MBP8123291.1 DUF4269 domain-containing protein [Caldilineaceae bacterium]MBP9073523.1 DUF4269 domain-containing protein [Caldilineaceae bacterium]